MEREKLVALVDAVQQAKPNAAADLYNAFYKDLYFHIYKTVDDADLAEDLLQETFMEIFLKIKDLKEPAAFVTWSRQIAYSKCTAYFRKTHEILVDENEEGYSIFDTLEEDREEFIPGEALDKEDFKQAIQQIISQLPGEQRSAILLHYFDELSIKDIAEIQGVTEGTVKSRLNYGRKAIKQGVEAYEKKNGIKLHCLGVAPLLLWLLKAQLSGSEPPVSAATMFSAATTQSIAGTSTSSGVASMRAASAAKAGAKVASHFAIKKFVAIIIAAIISVLGISTIAIIRILPNHSPTTWVGVDAYSSFSQDFEYSCATYTLTVDEMDDSKICGQLEIKSWGKVVYSSDFSGTREKWYSEEDGKWYDEWCDEDAEEWNLLKTYALFFDTPLDLLPFIDNEEIAIVHDGETNILAIGYLEYDTFEYYFSFYNNLQDSLNVLVQGKEWSGTGYTGFRGMDLYDAFFTLDIDYMTEEEICGTLSLSYEDSSCGESGYTKFTGYGHNHEGTLIHYQLFLEEPYLGDPDQIWSTIEILYYPQGEYFLMSYEVNGYDRVCPFSALLEKTKK